MTPPNNIIGLMEKLLYESNIPPKHEVYKALLIAVETLEKITAQTQDCQENHAFLAHEALSKIRSIKVQ